MKNVWSQIKSRMKNKWLRRTVFVGVGALAGFGFYYFIGCNTGACPLTSNPIISIGYGSVMGLMFSTDITGS